MIGRSFLRFLRETGLGLLKRVLLGAAAFLGPISPAVRPLVEREVVRPALDALKERRVWELEFKRAKTRWVASVVPRERWGEPVGRNQLYAVDVVVVGPDGQVITIQNLVLPTGRGVDDEMVRRRLAAELKRLEEKGKIEPIGDDPSGYCDEAIIQYDAYLWTIQPLKG